MSMTRAFNINVIFMDSLQNKSFQYFNQHKSGRFTALSPFQKKGWGVDPQERVPHSHF